MIDTVCIIGVGLIGGSLASGLRKSGWCKNVVGVDANEQTIVDAQRLNIIDKGYTRIAECEFSPDIVVVAVPLSYAKTVFHETRHWVASCRAYTDVGSTKQSVLADLADEFDGKLPNNFVPGHPIAGREQSGVLAAVDNLFVDRKVILTPDADTRSDSVELVTEMWTQVGAHVEQLGAEVHDQILAATSHLPHALAFALVHCLSTQTHTPEIFRYAAGGFADFTRIASSDPLVWRDICLANRRELLKAIDEFDVNLKQLRTSLENSDGDALQNIFLRAKNARDEYSDGC